MVTPIDISYAKEKAGDKDLFLVKFDGELDETNIEEAAKEVYAVVDESGEGSLVVFDFSKLQYLNSKSIGYLSDWYTKLSERSSKLGVAAAQDNIQDILQTVGLDNFVTMYPSVEEAKKSMSA